MRILLQTVFVFLLALSAAEAAMPPAKQLTPQDQQDITRITDYLNGMKVLQGRILQLNPDGGTIGGVLKIQRPGKLRLDYDAPAKSFLVADGAFVHFWDDTLGQTSSVPQDGSPAALILDAQIDLKKSMTITDVSRSAGVLEITVFKTDDPNNGMLTLVFNDSSSSGPLRIRQWRVRDAQNTVTQVTLQNIDQAVSFPSGTFTYRPPNFGMKQVK